VDTVFGSHATREELEAVHAEIDATITQLVGESRRLSDDSRSLTLRVSELAMLPDAPLHGRNRRRAREECAEHVFAIEMNGASLAILTAQRHDAVQGMVDDLVLKYRDVIRPAPTPDPPPPTKAIITFSPVPVTEPEPDIAPDEETRTRRPFGPQP